MGEIKLYPREVEQTNAERLNVTVENFPIQDHMQNLPYYKELPHNTTTVVWTPASGNKIHLVSLVVSPPAAGYVILYKRTPGAPPTDTIFIRLEFSVRTPVPLPFNTDIDFDWNQQLVALWVADIGNPTSYITAIGHEHTPANFPP